MQTRSTLLDRNSSRHDFYQTNQLIHISIYVKGLSNPEVQVRIESRSLDVRITPNDSQKSPASLVIDPLFAQVDVGKSSYEVKSSKIEVHLFKNVTGQWSALQGSAQGPLTQSREYGPVMSVRTSGTTSDKSTTCSPRSQRLDRARCSTFCRRICAF